MPHADYAVTVLTPPSRIAVELVDVKKHLEIHHELDDTQLRMILEAATQRAQRALGRQLITASLRLTLDAFPGRGCYLRIPFPPLQSISSINYYDQAGDAQTVDLADVVVSSEREPAVLSLLTTGNWPTTRPARSSVWIDYVAGYGTDASTVPEMIRMGILQVIGHWKDHQSEIADAPHFEMPKSADSIFRTMGVGETWIDYAPV